MITIIFSVVCIACCLAIIISMGRINYFNPIIFLLIFSIADVYFPAIYWSLYGQVNNPDWLNLLDLNSVQYAIAFYAIFYAILFCTYISIDKSGRPKTTENIQTSEVLSKLSIIIWVLFILSFAQVGFAIMKYGGIEPWIESKVILVFGRQSLAEDGFATELRMLEVLPLRDIFQSMVGLGFFYRKKFKSKRLFEFVFPALAIFLALATFLRGSVLACVLTLIFAEIMRRQSESHDTRTIFLSTKGLRFILVILIATLSSLFLYGAVRDSYRSDVFDAGSDAKSLTIPTFFAAGYGLLGLSHITLNYGRTVDYLYGKTYFDMIMLPVPRFIYTSKPDWYGIDDITRGMGWPESTQSAVTMPGEAFANFGLLGLIMAFPLGCAFGWLHKMARRNFIRYVLLGPSIFFQLTSVANWMSFTGIMNSAQIIFILFILSNFINKSPKYNPSIRVIV